MPAHGSRFVMNFSNKPNFGQINLPIYNSIAPNLAPKPRVASNNNNNNGDFRASMIGRVHKAKAGCSACGKKMG
jgi:hypothetical protein